MIRPIACMILLGIIAVNPLFAEINLVPNPSFEYGDDKPTRWESFTIGRAQWEFGGVEGRRFVSLTGTGEDTAWWEVTGGLALAPNAVYYTSFWLKKEPAAQEGVAISGLELVNRDFVPTDEWTRREFYFRTPERLPVDARFRLGLWQVRGKVMYDSVIVRPAIAIHRKDENFGLELGAGEEIINGHYQASHPLGEASSNDWRCLQYFTARFNTNRWVFGGPGTIVYRHSLGRLRHQEPEIEVQVNLWEQGSLLVEASQDGQRWRQLNEINRAGLVAIAVPSELLPAREIWVRLRSSEDASLQVDRYVYRARIPEAEPITRIVGQTHYLAIVKQDPSIAVTLNTLGSMRPEGVNEVAAVIENKGERRSLGLQVIIEQDDQISSKAETRLSLAPRSTRRFATEYNLAGTGLHTMRLLVRQWEEDAVLWMGETTVFVSPLYETQGGEVVYNADGLAIWWCEPEWKVSKTRSVPDRSGESIMIEAAGNEYESAQFIFRSDIALSGLQLSASELVNENGRRIAAEHLTVRNVEYVFINNPTDEVGVVDWWPDALPLHDAPVDIQENINQPFWITVYIPSGTPAGEYRGVIAAEWEGGSVEVPISVRVWGFDLPQDTQLRSGFGLSRYSIARYHNLSESEDIDYVFDLYLKSFAAYRIAPYDVGARISVEWEEGLGPGLYPKLDYSAFEKAARFALDELGFNSFRISLEGLGWGTFHDRTLGRIGDFEQGTPEHEISFTRYASSIQNYLEQRGWLDKAYVYWFDEPAERDFDFVREGMELIKRAAPKLTRLLTTKPDPRLYNAVDLWCLPTYQLDSDVARVRQLAGEELWWYLCTAPKAPYFTLFIDHHGTEMRLWSWATWKYGLEGLLIWDTVYWTSGNAYPDSLQNPWEDPMSWQSGYGLERGAKSPWGNGDGRLFYPPNRRPGEDTQKYLVEPIPSIRLELLRDGIEDYEYMWLLSEQIDRLKVKGVDPGIYRQAEELLEVPEELLASTTSFTTRPEPIHKHRRQVARAIEELSLH